MSVTITRYLIPALLFIVSCKSTPRENLTGFCLMDAYTGKGEKVSLKDPQRIKELHGKFVEVEGIFRYGFEDVGLYATKHASSEEAVWIGSIALHIDSSQQIIKLAGREIVMTGKIDTTFNGHMGAYIATLDSIVCIKLK